MQDIIFSDQKYVAHTYARVPVILDRGQGSTLWDTQGRSYIDMGAGLGVNSLGTADPQWLRAVTAQLWKLPHSSNVYYHAPCAKLAEALCEKTGMKKVFFSNSGAEANECAIKAARKYSAWKKSPQCYWILTMQGSFHGRTLATLAATGQACFHTQYAPLPGGFLSVPPDMDAVRAAVRQYPLAGIFLESIQGESGVRCLPGDFIRQVSALCREMDIPLIMDEVQTGNGRTGLLYDYMYHGITPDGITTAKGLAGGLPLGATLLGEKLQDVFTVSDHGSTFGGNPAACAGALHVLSRLTEPFLAQVREKGAYIFSRLEEAPGITAVTGRGLMIGVQTKHPAEQVQQRCRE